MVSFITRNSSDLEDCSKIDSKYYIKIHLPVYDLVQHGTSDHKIKCTS